MNGEKLLNIEIDGPSHLHPGGIILSEKRDKFLRERGILVARVDNTAMLEKAKVVRQVIQVVAQFDADLAAACEIPSWV